MKALDGIKNVLLVDDFHLCRTFFAEGLRQRYNFTVFEAANAEDSLQQVERCCPEVIILNISMRHCSGMALLQFIRRQFPGTGLLAFSYLHHDQFYAERAICAGAGGYISAGESGANMQEALETIAAGGVYLSPPLHKKWCGDSFRAHKKDSPFEMLSHREFEVFCLTGHGHVPKRIADMLKVSVKTIETYRERIRGKLGLTDGGELLYYATSFIREQSLSPQP
jgi:DNA-binding NarL/FixJ family response regulator